MCQLVSWQVYLNIIEVHCVSLLSLLKHRFILEDLCLSLFLVEHIPLLGVLQTLITCFEKLLMLENAMRFLLIFHLRQFCLGWRPVIKLLIGVNPMVSLQLLY